MNDGKKLLILKKPAKFHLDGCVPASRHYHSTENKEVHFAVTDKQKHANARPQTQKANGTLIKMVAFH